MNDEFGALTELLRTLPTCLRPGGRVAILSFHSGEDRRVKSAFKEGLRDRPLRLDCRGGDPPLSRREAGKSSVVVGKAEVCRPQLESPPSSSTARPLASLACGSSAYPPRNPCRGALGTLADTNRHNSNAVVPEKAEGPKDSRAAHGRSPAVSGCGSVPTAAAGSAPPCGESRLFLAR